MPKIRPASFEPCSGVSFGSMSLPRNGMERTPADLADRGLDFTEPRLYVLDGGKALKQP
jgi:hypothetical protein